MKSQSHLVIEGLTLQPGEEWAESDPAGGWLFVHVTHGAAYWLGSSRSRSLTEGEMLVLAPAVKGSVRASQIGPVTLHFFRFASNLLWGFFTLAERHFLESGPGDLNREVRFFPSTHPATQRFAGLIPESGEPGNLVRRIEVFGVVAVAFDQDMPRRHTPPSHANSALHRFTQFIAQMPDSEIINHTPDQLARLCGCSARHFNRLFHKQFGVSARKWQAELRLTKAQQLLRDTDARIAQVAFDSGYRNLGLFNALFKKRFGTTPSSWRRSVLDKGDGAGGAALGLVLLLLGASFALAGTTAAGPGPASPAHVGVRLIHYSDPPRTDTFRTFPRGPSHRIDT